MVFYAAERRKELLSFATAWMELESITLSDISQAVRDSIGSFGKSLFKSAPLHLLVIPLFVILLLSYCSSLSTLDTSHLTNKYAENIVFPLYTYLLIFLVVSFKGQ